MRGLVKIIHVPQEHLKHNEIMHQENFEQLTKLLCEMTGTVAFLVLLHPILLMLCHLRFLKIDKHKNSEKTGRTNRDTPKLHLQTIASMESLVKISMG